LPLELTVNIAMHAVRMMQAVIAIATLSPSRKL